MIASIVPAVRLLTLVPIPGREPDGRGAFGKAAWRFPVVGFALGVALVAVGHGLHAV
jgi:cobalamin synthase